MGKNRDVAWKSCSEGRPSHNLWCSFTASRWCGFDAEAEEGLLTSHTTHASHTPSKRVASPKDLAEDLKRIPLHGKCTVSSA